MRNLKRVLSLALALVMVLGMMVITTSAADFADKDEITYEEAMDVMVGLGLFKGDNNNAVNPQGILTRQDAATLMARIMLGSKADKLVATKQIFADVPANDWAAKYIEYCYNTGLIGGYTQGGELVFNPEGKLTGVAFAKLLLCAMGYNADAQGYGGSNWASAIAVDALYAGLTIDGVVISADLTREQAAQMILQALDGDMVKYTTAYDYATGAAILIGPNPVEYTGKTATKDDYDLRNKDTDGTIQFAEKYFSNLKKDNASEDNWGRPADYCWEYNKKPLYTEWYTPVAVYTEAVAECDIAEELGLEDPTAVTALTINGVPVATKYMGTYLNNNNEINPTATRAKVGEQGRLVEIYETDRDVYEIVMIDTFLAKVTDVTEVEYDRNGHIEEMAELELVVYTKNDNTKIVLESDEDWEYTKGQMLLIYAETTKAASKDIKTEDDDDFCVEILGEAEAMEGGQTAYSTDPVHIVEDVEYPDAYQFNLDEAGNQTSDHIWYFDTYGNLIGVEDPAEAAAAYGVITSIYWVDSHDGEDGYAKAVITYMDGEEDTVVVSKINGVTVDGVEGAKNVKFNNKKVLVSTTKSHNKDLFTNNALYEITTGKDGLLLNDTTLVENAKLVNGVTTLKAKEAYADKYTMFLIWTGKTYETVTGIKNIDTYKGTYDIWAADITEDTDAEYVFVTKPEGIDAVSHALYFANNVNDVFTALEDDKPIDYTVSGGYVDGEAADIVIEAKGETHKTNPKKAYTKSAIYKELKANAGKLVILELTDGYVTDVTPVTDDPTYANDAEDLFAVYMGTLGTGATINGKETILKDAFDGTSYDVDEVEIIGADDWDEADGKYVYVVYTTSNNKINGSDKTAITVYVSSVMGDWENAPATVGSVGETGLNMWSGTPLLLFNLGEFTYNESIEYKLYSDDTLIAEAYLAPVNKYFTPGTHKGMTGHFHFDDDCCETHIVTWYDMTKAPTSWEIWIDGVKMFANDEINYKNGGDWDAFLASLDLD